MKNSHMIITIDGPAGVGKSTLAGRLAESFKIAYLDTGAMYRAVGWMLGNEDPQSDENKIKKILESISFGIQGSGWNSRVTLNKKILGDEIRTEEVGMRASDFARLEIVREYLTKSQQSIGQETSLVAEGRDMGSIVFTNAHYKFFLDASARIRAERRKTQLLKMGKDADYNLILEQIIKRDEQDRNRAIAPLKPAPDAFIIDTGHLNPDQVFEQMKKYIENSPL
ncbi:MAG: (d)CMP kinase [Desulfonatronovibrio sp.]